MDEGHIVPCYLSLADPCDIAELASTLLCLGGKKYAGSCNILEGMWSHPQGIVREEYLSVIIFHGVSHKKAMKPDRRCEHRGGGPAESKAGE
jgi:hypothetical protein